VIKFLPNRSSSLTLCRGQRKVNAKEPIEQNHNANIAFQIGLLGRRRVSLNFFLLCHGSRKFKLPATSWCDGLRTAASLRYDYKRVFAQEDVISYPLPT